MATIWSKSRRGMNDWGDPVSSRARQRNRDVEEAPLISDGKTVNVMAPIVTTPLFKSRPCSDMRGSLAWLVCSQEQLRYIVVGHRIHEIQENCVVGVSRTRCRIEAKFE